MSTTERSRKISASPWDIWEVIRDPHHLPRWWPRVERVESVEGDAFTEVMKTAKGRTVRADFLLTELDEEHWKLVWAQQLEGSPFARLLKLAETELHLSAVEGGTETQVTIMLHQILHNFSSRGFSYYFPRLGAFLVRRAAAATIEEALDGLERISG